jgi:hypothetical protein
MRERGSGTVLVTGSGSADRPIPSMATVAALYAELVAETAGPPEQWRTVVDLTP